MKKFIISMIVGLTLLGSIPAFATPVTHYNWNNKWWVDKVGTTYQINDKLVQNSVIQIREHLYYFDTTGYMVIKNWTFYNNNWIYSNYKGELSIGWELINNKWYYFNSNGIMVTGTQYIDGKTYNFTSNGDWIG